MVPDNFGIVTLILATIIICFLHDDPAMFIGILMMWCMVSLILFVILLVMGVV